jgi:hypothetical protein
METVHETEQRWCEDQGQLAADEDSEPGHHRRFQKGFAAE